ncbi:MAG: hypothetical protein IJK06_12570 [Clostridia bacterium]|nr:hypothetical protein [Clostridia bacterium]
MNKQSINLNIRYSLYQFGYWVDYLIIASFGAVLLKARGFEPGEIGYVTTIGTILTIVLQIGLSSLADSSGHITVQKTIEALKNIALPTERGDPYDENRRSAAGVYLS